MPHRSTLLPRQPVPALKVNLAGGGRFDLAAETPEQFTLLVFYRGLHCPICKTQLKDLETKLPEFAKRGVGVLALSSDAQDRAERAKADWGLTSLRLGYGLALESAARLGPVHLRRAEARPRPGSRSRPSSRNPPSTSFDPTGPSISGACRRCRSPVRTSPTSSRRSISSWPRATPPAARSPTCQGLPRERP